MISTRKDGGAKFWRCDLQVHTPRDPGWEGVFDVVTSESDRHEYAKALVADCRRRGLDAIAITDHHDLCLYKWIRAAARAETAKDGTDLPEDAKLVVFPGMELTLAEPPLQALLILDLDLPDTVLDRVPASLGIAQVASTEAKHAPTTALATQRDLRAITSTLDDLVTNPEETNPNKKQTLRGRFILLPHVRKGGHKSVIRDGFNRTYSEMPCVGGYIEKRDYDSLESGNKTIVEGGDPAWGSKAIGVFPTSDCRSAREVSDSQGSRVEFGGLGEWAVWVKWTVPCAEALRQACLARSSRLLHAAPRLPTSRIVDVRVKNAKFLGDDELLLSPQFNALIGGRGTGKSSLLEYIRWSLCDSPVLPSIADPGELDLPDYQKRRRSLIEKTLKPDGIVTLHYEKNGVFYEIERSASDRAERVTVRERDGTTREVFGEQVRREFPLVSYAQKQLSCVGTLPEEVRRLVDDPVRAESSRIKEEIEEVLVPKLRELRQRELRLQELLASSAEQDNLTKSLREQISSVQSQLKGLGDTEQAVIAVHDGISREQQWVADAERIVQQMATVTGDAIRSLTAVVLAEAPDSCPNTTKVAVITEALRMARQAALDKLIAAQVGLASGSVFQAEAGTALAALRAAHTEHATAYAHCIALTAKNEHQLTELRSLNEQLSVATAKISKANSEIASLRNNSSAEKEQAWQAWKAKHQERSSLLETQCNLISEQAQYLFRARVKRSGSLPPMIDALGRLSELGANIRDRDEKVKALASLVADDTDSLDKWQEVISEFEALLMASGSSNLPDVPLLTVAGFTGANLQALVEGLTRDSVEASRYTPLEDEIIFEFAFGRDTGGTPRYIPFIDASPGQQATALMKTLLAEEGPPLLIDQPEEDLDNEQIREVADDICATKQNRQLLFVSHNANIVVNGDAELVMHFCYTDPDDRTKGTIDRTGSIDYTPIREVITSVMEGGREAFDLRKEKYGF